MPGVKTEARERLTLIRASDVDMGNITEHDLSRASESAYRRGYTQGFWHALESARLTEDPGLSKIYLRLYNWRFARKHDGSMECPPGS